LEVGYNIILNRTPIEKLPNNLIVHGSLNLGECKNITSLPTGLKIKYCLDLRNAKITKLPSDLEVEGSILLQSTPLSNLSWNEIKKMIPKVKGDILL
jgi:hypothetical protein